MLNTLKNNIKGFISFGAVVFSLIATGCQDNSYVIEGTLYGGRNFEDQVIYLVPFAGSSAGEIDSAVIHDSHFRFDGTADRDAVYCLRMRPMMRLFIEELVVIREPGHLRTRLSQTSYAKGTPLNDSLQNWRDFKMHIDSAKVSLRKRIKRAEKYEPERAAVLQAKFDSLSNVFNMRNRDVVERNSNAYGEYVERFCR